MTLLDKQYFHLIYECLEAQRNYKLLCFWFHSWGFDGAGPVRLCLPSGPEGDPQPGRAWGQTFSQSAPWVSLGYCWDCAGGSKGFFEIDQQETHWRKCCHSPRGGSNWPPPPAGCEIRGGPAPSSQDGKLHAPWSLLLGRRASVVARPLDPGSNALASVTGPLFPSLTDIWKVQFTKGEDLSAGPLD